MASRSEVWVVAGWLALAGCGDGDAVPGDAGSADSAPALDAGTRDAGVEDPEPIAWEPCPAVTGLGGREAECATVPLPLDWSDPGGETIGVFVKRLPGTGGGQLWLLYGGPGLSAASFEGLADEFQGYAGGVDVYMLEHRGVGRSGRLGCPSHEDALGRPVLEDLDACLDELEATSGELLPHVGTTNAARDLAALVERTRSADEDVFVYGVSYGTWWAHRYLQVAPDQPTGVILDSVCPPNLCAVPQPLARNYDTATRQLLTLCADDAECGAHLGDDPVAFAEDVLSRLADGHCPDAADAGLDVETLRVGLGRLMQDQRDRYVVPAVFHRLDRCDAGDRSALAVFADLVTRPPSESFTTALHSFLLNAVVMRSEMWAPGAPESVAGLRAFLEPLLVLYDDPPYYRLLLDAPTYDGGALVGAHAATDVPVLMINGTLDTQTPLSWAEALDEGMDAPNTTVVAVERAAHWVVLQSQYELGDATRGCGWDLLQQFVAAPHASLDTGCATEVADHDFTRDTATALATFGTSSLYGPSPPGAVVALDERARAIRERMRRTIWATGP